MVQQKQQAERVSGVSNVAYDLISVMNNKLEGIAALEVYKQDAQGNDEVQSLFNDLQQQATQDVSRIKGLLVQQLGQ
jgi:hypothetical protein